MKVANKHALRVLLTRSEEGNEVLSKKLEMEGFEPLGINTIRFEPPNSWVKIDEAISNLSTYDWVVFTSTTGVRYFISRMRFLHSNVPWIGKPHVAVVGNGTAAALEAVGVKTSFVPSSYTTTTLARELPGTDGKNVLLLRSNIASKEMNDVLKARGFKATEYAIYQTHPVKGRTRLEPGLVDVVTFASPSAVDSFCKSARTEELKKYMKKPTICIGPVTAHAARKWGFARVTVARTHTFDALVEEIRSLGHNGS